MKLLIDADMLLFKCLTANEEEFCIHDEVWTRHCDLAVVRQEYHYHCSRLAIHWNCREDDLIHCFTDRSAFRRELSPNYKHSRKSKPKPIGYKPMKDELLQMPNAYMHKAIEADDLIGIFASRLLRLEEDYAVVTRDKDMNQIPGWHCWLDEEAKWVSPGEASKFFWKQLLVGDRADDIAGVPTIGDKRAEALTADWDVTNPAECWKQAVKLFAEKGKMPTADAETTALQTARLIYILQEQDYNFKTEEVTLWNPTTPTPRKRSLASGSTRMS
jgi:DNA polymerase-1